MLSAFAISLLYLEVKYLEIKITEGGGEVKDHFGRSRSITAARSEHEVGRPHRSQGVGVSVRSVGALVAAASVLTLGCSSSPSKSGTPAAAHSSTTTEVPLGAPYTRPACTPPAATPVVAAAVAGSTSDFDLTSFDGTRIRIHWFPVHDKSTPPAPTVLKGPGWGQAGDTNTAGSGYGLFGDMSIHSLNAAGYNVLTWDPRGFGKSNGTVHRTHKAPRHRSDNFQR